ncbi:MAG TPA: HD domain-containing protein [Bacteroidales bacterium]|nr:HD domain-containing protein [Bacteroidales bacterium]OQB62310.1 MAG: HD domain protein [Bacteroidetes bacterium ADurb.Bin145]HOU02536.1 HD domain-containing protein [Bacteroidales bacterium]HQG63843.1 HD domain-containing protein [Bacteroidales bacterium]HQK67824.1 HD domain-containing protein [Bacteroidales bacterium]
MAYRTNKRKIINDPVYGFINIPGDLIFDLIENPWFQRLRNIRQLGLTSFVYPGANHSRFQHCLGAMHLMEMAISTLRSKGTYISPEEEEAVFCAILLHDSGHGPFSHALENSIISGITHEDLSLLLMKELNERFGGRLELAIEIFKGNYKRRFLHDLIAGQIDMDRLDYLRRDSFFTGVIEGSVGSDRIIRMLNVVNDELVVDEKGIYSLEKFLIARRLMYWQVYMHKTVIASETLLVNVLKRAKQLASEGRDLYATPALRFFLYNSIGPEDLLQEGTFTPGLIAANFTRLDDTDIYVAAKYWADDSDKILAELAGRLMQRNLFAVELQDKPFSDERIEELKSSALKILDIIPELTDYYIFTASISNLAYTLDAPEIKILLKSGKIADISEVSDMCDNRFISEKNTKYFLSYPKECR